MPIPDAISFDINLQIIRQHSLECQPGFGIQSKLKTKKSKNGAKLISLEQFCFLFFTECRSLVPTLSGLHGFRGTVCIFQGSAFSQDKKQKMPKIGPNQVVMSNFTPLS